MSVPHSPCTLHSSLKASEPRAGSGFWSTRQSETPKNIKKAYSKRNMNVVKRASLEQLSVQLSCRTDNIL